MQVFISYSHNDRRLCDECKTHLAALSRVERVQAWRDDQILAGGAWRKDIKKALYDAHVVLLLISADFLASKFIWKMELPHALARHRRGECVVVPVIIKSVEGWRDVVGELQALPAGGKPIKSFRDRDSAWAEVMRRLRVLGREKGLFLHNDDQEEADDPSPLFNIPRPENPFFTGRDDDLAWIKRILNTSNHNRTRPVALLHGTGGVGKSEAAAHYAHKHRDEYQAVWWIDAERPATRDEGFSRLAEALGLQGFNPRDMKETRAAVLQWMENASGWLAIFDNAESPDELRPWLPPRAGGHLLVTSRNPAWRSVADALPLDVWDIATAAAYLRERSGDEDMAASQALAADLGCLPLACEHAAAYVEDSGCGLAGYSDLLKQRFDKAAPVVFRTFTLAMEKAAEQAPLAETVMNLCACLAPEPIPRTLFSGEEGLGVLGTLSTPAPVDIFALNAAFAALRRQALIAGQESLTLHRLVQATARSRLSDPQNWDVAALTLTAKAFPFDAIDARNWEDCARLRPHAETLLAAVPDAAAPPGTTDVLCNQLGLYLQQRGDYPAALALFERNLQLSETRFGPKDGKTAIALSNLGGLLRSMGRLEAAEPHTRRALDIDEGNLGPDHPEVAIRLSNLATILHDQQHHGEAETLLRRALPIFEANLGADHPNVAACLSNLGEALRRQGKHGAAKPLQERALEIDRAHYGDDHPEIATDLNNLAGTLFHLGYFAGAVERLAKAAAIWERWLGPDHPHTQQSRRNLAIAEAPLRAG
jgi:tetratricopeptide (TPR) repeat protein